MFGVSERSKSVEHHVSLSKSNVVFILIPSGNQGLAY